ncbi:uncharacterized protein LOC142572928 isoform X2 [Dermacentor variabilis]|uniref:uncharacterized protein LOC142572928 isoform X2 n=1 Tax=Dermacentor variabilis TaxID=34621 RepID=UPI003F5C592B
MSWQAATIFTAGSLHGGVLASADHGGKLLQGNAGTWLKAAPFRCCCALSRRSYPYQGGQVLQRSICDRKGLWFIGDFIGGSSRLTTTL